MGDNTPYANAEQAQPAYVDPPRPSVEDVLRALAEGQRMNQDTMNGLAQAVAALVKKGARRMASAAEVAGLAETVFLSLPNPEIVQRAALDQGIA